VTSLFPDEVGTFADESCELWEQLRTILISDLPGNEDRVVELSVKLRKMIHATKSTQTLLKLFGTIITVTSHSCMPERIVSNYNLIVGDKRSSMSEKAINDRLMVGLNGKETANFDPRPSVAEFIQIKERQNREPDVNVYKGRDFIRKFFHESKK